MLRIVAAAMLAALTAVVGASRQQMDPPLVLAAVIGNDALLPIGTYSNGRWRNDWPLPEDGRTAAPPNLGAIPDAWLGVRLPERWTIVASPSATLRRGLSGVKRHQSCEGPIVLSLDAVAPSAPADSGTLPIGLASNRDEIRVGAFRTVRNFTTEPAGLDVAVRRAYREFEPRALAQTDNQGWLQEQLEQVTLSKLPLEIVGVATPASAKSGPYYFEAARRTKVRGRDFGVAVRGWLRRDAAGAWVPFTVSGVAFGSDSAQASPGFVATPRGALTLDQREYWIFKERGYESADFVVYQLEPSSARAVVRSSLGGC